MELNNRFKGLIDDDSPLDPGLQGEVPNCMTCGMSASWMYLYPFEDNSVLVTVGVCDRHRLPDPSGSRMVFEVALKAIKESHDRGQA